MVKQAQQQVDYYQYSPSLIGRQKEAIYPEQEIPDYMGNPFIEALPPIFEEEDMIHTSSVISYRHLLCFPFNEPTLTC